MSKAHLNSVFVLIMNVRAQDVTLALRSGSTIANEVYPRRGYC